MTSPTMLPGARGRVLKRNHTGASDRWVSKYDTGTAACRRALAAGGLSGAVSFRTRMSRASLLPDTYWLSQHTRATMETTPITIGIR